MDDDSVEDDLNEFEDDTDDLDDGLSGDEQESDGFDSKNAFFIGSIVGNAYEEGQEQRKHRELLRKKRARRNPESG